LSEPTGGSDPEKLFGRLKAEKVGSLPPVSVVCPALLLKFLSPMLRVLRSLDVQKVGIQTAAA